MLNLSEQLVKRGHRVTITCRPGLYVETAAQERGLRTVPITVIKQQDWHDRDKLRALMHAERFDVVHAHWRPDYVVSAAIARLSGVPVNLLSHHSPVPMKPKEVFTYRASCTTGSSRSRNRFAACLSAKASPLTKS